MQLHDQGNSSTAAGSGGDDSGFAAPFLLDIRKTSISPFYDNPDSADTTSRTQSPSSGFPPYANDRRPSLADRRRSSRSNPYSLRSHPEDDIHGDAQDGGPRRFSDQSKLGPGAAENGHGGVGMYQQDWITYNHSRSSSISSLSSATSSWSDVDSIRMADQDMYSQHVPGMASNFTFPAMPGYGLAPPQSDAAPSSLLGLPGISQHDLESGNGDFHISAYVEALRNSTGSNSQNEKIKIAFVHKWLNQSFYLHPEGNVSRQALYGSYIYVCEQYGITPINAASYGKAVRSCWPGIKTRRLGVRGCSRYHYCGIRPASKAIDDIVTMANANGSTGIGPPVGVTHSHSNSGSSSTHSVSPSSSMDNIASIPLLHPNAFSSNNKSPMKTESESSHSPIDLPPQPVSGGSDEDFHNLRRQASAPSLIAIPQSVNSENPSPLPDFSFPDLKTPTAPHFLNARPIPQTHPAADNTVAAAAAAYLEKGRRATFPNLQITVPPLRSSPASAAPAAPYPTIPEAHTQSSYQVFIPPQQINLNLPSFEEIVARAPQIAVRTLDQAAASYIWSTYKTEYCQAVVKLAADGRFEEYETTLRSFWSRLDADQQRVCQHPVLSDALYTADTVVLETFFSRLHEQVLQPAAAGLQDKLQTIANQLESWTGSSLRAFPPAFAGIRMELASRTAHLINRHLGIAQLAQALNGIFARPGGVDELIAAWATINFEAITNQAALVTSCTQQSVTYYLEEFKRAMLGAGQDPVTAFAGFADASLEYALAREPHNKPADVRSKEFLLKWNYIVSQITRDLTIRSNATFGPFQILSLFIQEWLAFKVLKNFALHAHAVAGSISVDAGPRHMQHMMHDTSTYLVSPDASGVNFPDVPRSARSNPAVSAAHPAPMPSAGLGSVPGLSFNFASALSPTTRAIFGDTRTPVYLNFGHLPPTPSALQMQRSPGFRPPLNFPAVGNTFPFDDFNMPIASPARMNYHPFR